MLAFLLAQALEDGDGDIIAVPSVWLPIVSALVIPVLTGLVARYKSANRLPHALIAFVASGVLAAVWLLVDQDGGDTFVSLVVAFIMTFGSQLAAYLGVWQPVVKLDERLAGTARPGHPGS
jgi:hypothetical protein